MAKMFITCSGEPVITVFRHALRANKIVYFALANKPHRYPTGRSRIVYIGTTASGLRRIAESAALRAREILPRHGMHRLDFHVLACTPRRKVRTWRKLESALLLKFRETYGSLPIGNIAGLRKTWTDEREYFREDRLRSLLDRFEI